MTAIRDAEIREVTVEELGTVLGGTRIVIVDCTHPQLDKWTPGTIVINPWLGTGAGGTVGVWSPPPS